MYNKGRGIWFLPWLCQKDQNSKERIGIMRPCGKRKIHTWNTWLPYYEGRKKGCSLGIVKSEAQRRVNRLQRERAVAASDMDAIRGPSWKYGPRGCQRMRIRRCVQMRDTGGRKLNVLKSVIIIMWAITGTVNLIRHNIDRRDYLMVWVSLMAVLLFWKWYQKNSFQ